MLETIREYARERLAEYDPAGVTQKRHAEYFLEHAEANTAELFVDLTHDQMDWFEAEHDNLRAALECFYEQDGEIERELRLLLSCEKFWVVRGYWTEGRQRFDAALARADEAPPSLRARGLLHASAFAWNQGDYDRGKALAETALALGDDLGKTSEIFAYIMIGNCETLANPARMVEMYETAAAIARASGHEFALTIPLTNLGNAALVDGDFARARANFEEAAAMNRRLGFQTALANNLADLGFVALAESRIAEAAEAFRESLNICLAKRSVSILLWVVEGLAAVALERAAPREAALLLAATTRPRAELGFPANFFPIGEEYRERTRDAVRARLGDGAFAEAWAEGEALSLEAAAEKAAFVE
jgi:tetratricopeptide (TPR) repeat protein